MGRALGALALLIATIFPLKICGQTASCPAAMELFHQRRWTDAAAGFDECEKRDPGKTDALLYRGKALVNLRQFEEAASPLQAYVAFRQDKPVESLRLFSDAANLKPPTANDLTIAALDYVLLNDYSDAAHYLELALKMNPDDVEARYHLGRVRYQQNQFDLAIAAFQEVIKRDPANVKALDNLGLSFEAKNEVEAATNAYKKAIDLDGAAGSHSEQPYLNLGTLFEKSNRFQEAVPLLAHASEIAPAEFKPHYELAKVYFDSTQWESARQQAEKAVELNPKDSSSHYLLGRIYQRLGQKELANQEFQRTAALIRNKDASSQGGMASGASSR